jgi:hypothetical protein
MKIDTPEWAAKILERAAGVNLRGDPMYRVIWGWNRLELVGEQWTDYDPNTKRVLRRVIEQRLVPRYSHLGTNHWFVERWYPPEYFGSREVWEAKTIQRIDGIFIAALGPYPSNGNYDHFYTMEGKNGEFRQLTRGRVDWIASIIEDSEAAYRKKIYEAAERSKLADREAAEDAADLEYLKHAGRAFDGEPMVTVL